MARKYEYTPREEAYSITIGWIANAIKNRTDDLGDIEPPSRRKLVEKQLAKLHDRLLDESGLQGQWMVD